MFNTFVLCAWCFVALVLLVIVCSVFVFACCGCTSSLYIVFDVCLLNCVIALVGAVELLLFAFVCVMFVLFRFAGYG